MNAGPLRLEPVEGEVFRLHMPGVLFATWLDLRSLRSSAGRVTALSVTSARVRNLIFNRED